MTRKRSRGFYKALLTVFLPPLFSALWWPSEKGDGLLSGRDRLDLYERNRDIPDWTVRENWQYQKRAYLEGNTRIRSNNFRRRAPRSSYEPDDGYPYSDYYFP